MVNSVENISEQLFQVISGFGHQIVLFTDEGKKTTNPAEARRFYAKNIQMMVNYVVDETTNEIVVNLSKDTDIKSVKDMLTAIRNLANRYIIEYTVKTFGKSIKPRDFAYMAKNKVQEASRKPVDWQAPIGTGDTNTAQELRAKMQDKLVKSEMRNRGLDIKNESTYTDSAYDSAINEIEQLGEISASSAINAYRQRQSSADDYYGDPDDQRKADNTRGRIQRKFSQKIARDADHGVEIDRKGRPQDTSMDYLDTKSDVYKDFSNPKSKKGTKQRRDYMQLQKKYGPRFANKADLSSAALAARSSVSEGFSGWTGSARKSVNQLESARIIVKHKRNVDEEKRGARTRQIESIFIENAEGERFKFPSNNITAAKAMARHVQEGGAPFDDFGQHIYGIMEELNQLKTFNRKNKRNDFFEDAQIGEEITARIGNLRNSLKSMSTPRGYTAQMEGFTKESEDVSQERIDELKDATTMTYFDESIADSLPYVARVIETLRTRQANESRIVEFARQVMNNKGGFALAEACDDDDPESPSARTYKDKISEVAAWAAYLAPKVQNEALSSSLAQLEETLASVGSKHVSMAMSAINVVKQQGTVAEAKDIDEEKVDVEEAELTRISESMDKFDIRKIFGV